MGVKATWGSGPHRGQGCGGQVDSAGLDKPRQGVGTLSRWQWGAIDGSRAKQREDLELCFLKMQTTGVGEGLEQGEAGRTTGQLSQLSWGRHWVSEPG